MKNIKVVPANQDNGQPQLRNSLFGKAGELFSEEFSARVLKYLPVKASHYVVTLLQAYNLASQSKA